MDITRCINYDTCRNLIESTDPITYWEATVYIRDREDGGPNRRHLQRTGRAFCTDCSLCLEHNLPIGQEQLAL